MFKKLVIRSFKLHNFNVDKLANILNRQKLHNDGSEVDTGCLTDSWGFASLFLLGNLNCRDAQVVFWNRVGGGVLLQNLIDHLFCPGSYWLDQLVAFCQSPIKAEPAGSLKTENIQPQFLSVMGFSFWSMEMVYSDIRSVTFG